jgi:1-aminocyclopropane-1-carboxylate deaminase/D-cysteine desulfhydrase-like pyridoxal-dependent ACC family enzyme
MVGKENEALSNFLTKEWLQQVHHPLFGQYGIRVDILRLDLIHPMVSGNKWLKLLYWLEKYDSGDYKGILTAGGPWSNHLHACAFACHSLNIPMNAVVKGRQGMQTATLKDVRQWGSDITYTNRKAFYDEDFWEQQATLIDYLFIPMGGAGDEGKKGVTEWFNQLPLVGYDATFVSMGTGTTLQGIAESTLATKKIFGLDPGTRDEKLRSFCEDMQEKTHKTIHYAASGNKYGQLNKEMQIFMTDWYHHTRIPLDFVYTAPLCQHFIKQVYSGQFSRGMRILLVHTGGLQGNRSNQTV